MAKSATFKIAPDVFRTVITSGMLGFYGQRCGTAVNISTNGQNRLKNGGRIGGHLTRGPGACRRLACIGKAFLGEVEVAEACGKRGDDPPRRRTHDPVQLG